MKRLLEYRKMIVSLMCAVMIVSIGILSTSFNSCAEGTSYDQTFRVTYPEPATSDKQGYFCVMAWSPQTGEHRLNTYFWNIQTYQGDSSSITDFTATVEVTVDSNSITFVPYVQGSQFFEFSLCEFGSDDQLYIHKRALYKMGNTDANYTYYRNDSYLNAGCIFNGNVGAVYWGNLDTPINTPEVIFSNAVDSESLYSNFFEVIQHIDDLNNDVVAQLGDILTSTRSLEAKLDALAELQKETNSWLGKIWNSIQEFINPSDNDSQKADEFNNEANTQKSEIDDLNEQNKVDKVDVNSATAQVDANIDYDNMAQYGGVLAVITNNSYVLQMILIVVSIGIIAYVLFGKR